MGVFLFSQKLFLLLTTNKKVNCLFGSCVEDKSDISLIMHRISYFSFTRQFRDKMSFSQIFLPNATEEVIIKIIWVVSSNVMISTVTEMNSF